MSALAAQAQSEKNKQAGMGDKVQLMPRFMFGFKEEVKGNLHFLDQDVVVYPCGHNLVFYNIQDQSQRFIPGLEGSDGITAMALSSSRKYLAVCEKGAKAICVVYNVGRVLDSIKGENRNKKASSVTYDHQAVKTKRVLLSADLKAEQFISVDFCANEEKKQLVTVSDGPDCKVIIWNWDKQKCISFTDVQNLTPGCQVRQISFSPYDHGVILLTGKDVFKYYKLLENNTLKMMHSHVPKKEADVSKNYKCHAWLFDGRFIVCTDLGQIMLFESDGQYKQVQISDPKKPSFPINSCLPFTIGQHASQGDASGGAAVVSAKSATRSGFIVAGDSGLIRIYVKSDSTVMPYKRVEADKDDMCMTSDYERAAQQKNEPHKLSVYLDVKYHKITNLALSPREDLLLFSTDTSQIISVKINLDKPSDEQFPYDYLVSSFHSKQIHGLDLCIKKQLMATCANDRSVRLWSYNTTTNHFKLELRQQFPEEAFSIAIHPSGFHMVVGFQESVQIMNILDQQLQKVKEFKQIKSCREIKFSNGGQYFACTHGNSVQVFKFYTAESPPEFFFQGGYNSIRCISWLDDDSGFLTSGQDPGVQLWSLYPSREGDQRMAEAKNKTPIGEFKSRSVCFSALSVARSDLMQPPMIFYAAGTGTDRSIREVSRSKDGVFTEKRYEENVSYAEIQTTHQRRLLFAGVNDQNKPGSIQVFRPRDEGPFLEKILEVQCHHKQLERMRLNFENTRLFSVGQDGVVAIFAILDKEPRKAPTNNQSAAQQVLPQITYSDEILIEKEKRDKIQGDIMRLRDDIRMEKINNEEQIRTELNRQKEIIRGLEKTIGTEKNEFEEKLEDLESKRQLEEQKNEEALNLLDKLHREEVHLKNKEFGVKKAADEQRYAELVRLKEKQSNDFSNKISELYLLQEKQLKDLQVENALAQKQKDAEIKELEQKIEELLKQNKGKRKDIEDSAWEKIDKIKERNKDDLAQIIDLGMISKAKLTEVTGEYRTKKTRKEQLMTHIADMQTELSDLIALTKDLEANIESQKAELSEREATIKDKDKRIYDLKKKTQELEKFKFVLDYKIKELKRDIGPRQEQHNKLEEQTSSMEQEVIHFARVNNNLMLIVEDLRMRQSGLVKEKESLQKCINQQECDKKEFVDDVYDTLLQIEDYKKLKRGLVALYKKYVLEEDKMCKNKAGGSGAAGELASRGYLESQIETLKMSMSKNVSESKHVRSRFMKENVMLLQEINVLKKAKHDKECELRIVAEAQGQEGELTENEQRVKELEMSDYIIEDLKNKILESQAVNNQLRARRPTQHRPLPIENSDQKPQAAEGDPHGGQNDASGAQDVPPAQM